MRTGLRWPLVLACLLGAAWVCPRAGLAGLISGARVLTLPGDARALAMGEAYVALAGGPAAGAYNPAGLCRLTGPQAAATYLKFAEDTYFATAAFGLPAGAGTFAAGSLSYFDGGLLEVNYPDGRSESVKALQDLVLTASGALCISGQNCVGINAKLLSSRLAQQYTAMTLALDAGLAYMLWPNGPGFGLVLKNLGPRLSYAGEPDPLPGSLHMGLAQSWGLAKGRNLELAVEVVKPLDLDAKIHLGAEYRHDGWLAARMGYKIGYDTTGFTWGLGIVWQGLQVDYAQGVMGFLGLQHLATLSTRF